MTMEPVQTMPNPVAEHKAFITKGALEDDGYYHQRSNGNVLVRDYISVVVDGEEYWRSTNHFHGGEFFSLKPDVPCDYRETHAYCVPVTNKRAQERLLKKYGAEYDPTIVF